MLNEFLEPHRFETPAAALGVQDRVPYAAGYVVVTVIKAGREDLVRLGRRMERGR